MRLRHPTRLCLGLACLAIASAAAVGGAEVKVTVDRNVGDRATEQFTFKTVPSPVRRGVARATVAVVDGTPDEHCRAAMYLGKPKLPADADDPAENFFFAEGTDGGRLLVDLGSAAAVTRVNTYSWHPSSRGPQVYVLWGADGTAAGFDPAPKKGTDPAACGWTRVAAVDTRRAGRGKPGGQYGVTIADTDGRPIGTYRYLLMDVSETEAADGFGNTFYSKVEVFTAAGPTMSPTTLPAR